MSTAIAEFSEGLRRVGFLEPLIREVEKLTEEQKETLAWQLFDRVNIAVVLALRALRASDFIESRADFGQPPATTEEIRQAILKVSEQDWTHESQTAKELVDEEIEKLIANRTEV